MKFLLIALNALLAAALVHLVWISAADPVAFPSKTKAVSRTGIDMKTPAARTRVKKAANVTESPELVETKIEALVKRNVFNTERVPDAPVNKTAARAQQQIRADMSLVGTYTIGDSLGAIILQRLQGNAQQQLKALQQKEYEQYQASATRVTDPKKKAEAAAERANANASGDAEADNVVAGEDGDGKKVIVMGNPTVSANNVFRQHLKVGDTTVTGYKLVEVTRTSAVLTKNNERIELTLLSPSEAGNIARQRQQNNNNNARNNQNNNNARNNQNNNNRNNNARNNNNNNNRNNNNARNNNNNNRNNNNRNNNNNNRNNNRDEIEWF